jgi:geranylgeranyl diphosphate synthase type I
MVSRQDIEETTREPSAAPAQWQEYRDSVQNELKNVINGAPPFLREILRYHMGWGDKRGLSRPAKQGKFVRPILHILSCQAVGGETAKVLPSAAAVELIHNLSLVHDDIQDGSKERRGRPTVWKVWGKLQAINIGDFMFALASLALLRLRDRGVPGGQVIYSFRLLTEACRKLCQGQYLDIEFENRTDITVADYLDMIRKKTAALIAASASTGAYLAKRAENVHCFREFGEALGMAYQIRDDVVGIWGPEEITGKSVQEDLRQRKKSLPVVYALRESSDKAKLERLYAHKHLDSEDVHLVLQILNRSGARDHAQHLVQQYCRRALNQLEATGLPASRQAPLRELTHLLAERTY